MRREQMLQRLAGPIDKQSNSAERNVMLLRPTVLALFSVLHETKLTMQAAVQLTQVQKPFFTR